MFLGSVLGGDQKILALFYCALVPQGRLIQDEMTLGEDPFLFPTEHKYNGCNYLLVVTMVLRLGERKQSQKGQLEFEGKKYMQKVKGVRVVRLQIGSPHL